MRRVFLFLVATAVSFAIASSADAAAKAKKGAKGADQGTNILSKFDKNGDGALQPDEFAAMVAAREARRDAAGKGAPKLSADDLFKKLDKNSDGKIDASELSAMGKQAGAKAKKKSAT